ncbi:hypothetical protein QUF74_07205 [Candidatus Halobeggiatoa sp. HSG11]|nr:hypothetical protein [Candidatus Halobeggiatoa sp. HSG11]
MQKRLYFMLPDVEHCRQLVTELLNVGIVERDINIIANDDVQLSGLHEASALQKTELSHGLELGIGVGGVAGLLGGLLVVTFPPAGLVLSVEAIIISTTIAGASFGSIVSALVASDIPNHELEDFQGRIMEGHILLILDIAMKRVDEISTLIMTTHPEAEISVTTYPN